MRRRSAGFTLLELALVLLVITVLLGGLAVPFTRQIETRRIAETNKAMATIQDALVGYAMSHNCKCVYGSTPSGGLYPLDTANSTCNASACPSSSPSGQPVIHPYLPCPADATSNGLEDRPVSGGACAIPSNGINGHLGWLPWVTLGLPATDAWGNRYGYDVYLPYADSTIGIDSTSPPSLTTSLQAGQLFVCSTAAGCPATPATSYVASQVPAVVISYGPDGQGAFSENNNQWAVTPNQASAPDEYLNAAYGGSGNYRGYVNHPPTEAGSASGQFDDLVTWLSWPALVNRVCPAGGCSP